MNPFLYFLLAIIGGGLFQAIGLALLEHLIDRKNERRIEFLQRNKHRDINNHRLV